MTNSLRAGLIPYVDVLLDHSTSPGITASQLAKKVGTNRTDAMKRVSDLRSAGLKIFSNVNPFLPMKKTNGLMIMV